MSQPESGGQIVPLAPGPISISHHHNYNPNPNPGHGEQGMNQQATSDDNYFSFQDMDCFIQDFHGLSQAASSGMIMPPDPNQPGPSGYHYDPPYYDQVTNLQGFNNQLKF